MKTELEKKFFEAFELGGVADSCLRLVIDKMEQDSKPDRWERAEDERVKRVVEVTEAFDFSIVNLHRKAPIFQEIEANLRELTGKQRESYLYSLLTPFGDWVRIARGRADKYETEWSKEHLRQQAEQFFNILNGDYQTGTIERALQMWESAVIHYSRRLDAILLQEGEDLLSLQEITGVKLIDYRDLSTLEYYCGSIGIAEKYLAELNRTPQPDTSTPVITEMVIDTSTGATGTAPEGWRLPIELDTPEGWEIWRQAIEKKLITDDFRWQKGLQLLACFAREMSLRFSLGKGVNSDGTKRINWKIFEELFNIEKGKLRSNYNDIQKTGIEPNEIMIINEIFGV